MLTLRGSPVDVQPKSFDLLLYLIANRDRVVPLDELHSMLWAGVAVSPAALSRAVYKARQAVGDDGGAQRVIRTFHRHGFQFVARLRGEEPPSREAPADDFVGRAAELARLQRALDAARGGCGGLLVLAGEPGIGKTRTLVEFLARIEGVAGHLVACPDGAEYLAYWPWRQLARHLASECRAGRRSAGADRLLAVFSRFEPELGPARPRDESHRLRPDEMRMRLFQDVAEALRALTFERPLVLAIDDLHLADLPSLAFLRFLAPYVREQPLLLLATCRDSEMVADAERQSMLAEALRRSVGDTLELKPLAPEEVTLLAEKSAGVMLEPEQTVQAHRLSGGNPFFLVEILREIERNGVGLLTRAARPGERVLPTSIRAAVAGRLARLSPETQRVLRAGSVFGGDFALVSLALATDVSPDLLIRILDPAISARVLESAPRTSARYRFSHPLLREAIYEGLVPSARARGHLCAARALEALPGADPLELAMHWSRAAPIGGAERAFASAQRAAEICRTQLAFEAAVLHLEHALEALALLPGSAPEQRADVLIQLGALATVAGFIERGVSHLLEALRAARALSEPAAREERIRSIAEIAGPLASSAPEIRAVVRAICESVPLGDPVELDSSLALLVDVGGDPAASGLVREALQRARAAANPQRLARALCSWHWVEWRPDNARERCRAMLEVEALGTAAGSDSRLEARFLCALDALERGDRPALLEAQAALDQGAREAAHLRSRWRVLQLGAATAILEGRFVDADRLGSDALALAKRSPTGISDGVAGYRSLKSLRSFMSGAWERVEGDLRQVVDASPGLLIAELPMAHWCVFDGDLSAARRHLQACSREEIAASLASPAILEMTTVVASALRDEELCGMTRAHFLAYRGLHLILPLFCVYWGPASRYLGLLHRALGDLHTAEGHFAEALAACDALGAVANAIQVRCDWAQMLAERARPGDLRAARAQIADARAQAALLRARALVVQCDALREPIGNAGATPSPGTRRRSRPAVSQRAIIAPMRAPKSGR